MIIVQFEVFLIVTVLQSGTRYEEARLIHYFRFETASPQKIYNFRGDQQYFEIREFGDFNGSKCPLGAQHALRANERR